MLAFKLADLGYNVGLVTIDPARRLASALGIDLGGREKIIYESKINPKGSLSACMLDSAGLFEHMLHLFVKDEKKQEKIKDHSFYKSLSKNLGGVSEYLALAKIWEMVDLKKYDLILIDTPPDLHFFDLFAKPGLLARYFDYKVSTWLLKPIALTAKLGSFGLSKLSKVSEKVLGGLGKIAGTSALEEMAQFMILIQDLLYGFYTAATKIRNLLGSDLSHFIYVTSPYGSHFQKHYHMFAQMKAHALSFDLLVANLILKPQLVEQALTSDLKANLKTEFICQRDFREWLEELENKKQYTKALRYIEKSSDSLQGEEEIRKTKLSVNDTF